TVTHTPLLSSLKLNQNFEIERSHIARNCVAIASTVLTTAASQPRSTALLSSPISIFLCLPVSPPLSSPSLAFLLAT
ncbi:hypothetical protein S245_024734, partial [Arachis hypogaea]